MATYETDVKTNSIVLSLSRTGGQGAKGDPGQDSFTGIYDANATYAVNDLVINNALPGAKMYRAIIAQTAPARALTDTTAWQEIGADSSLTFADTTTIDLQRTGDVVTADVRDGTIGPNQLSEILGGSAGSYTNPSITVDATGRVTSIANGAIATQGAQLADIHAAMNLTHVVSGSATPLSELAEDGAAVTVTGSFTLGSDYTFTGTGDQGGNAGLETIEVVDGSGADIGISHPNLNDATFQFTITATERQTPQTITARAIIGATRTEGGVTTTYHANVSATIVIYRKWYSLISNSSDSNLFAQTSPTNVTGAVDQDRLNDRETATFTKVNTDDHLYVILPVGSTYEFQSGFAELDVSSITHNIPNTGTAEYIVHELTDFQDGEAGDTLEVEILTNP